MRYKIPSSIPAVDEETLIVPVSASVLIEALYKVGISFGWARSCTCLWRVRLSGSAGSSSTNVKSGTVTANSGVGEEIGLITLTSINGICQRIFIHAHATNRTRLTMRIISCQHFR